MKYRYDGYISEDKYNKKRSNSYMGNGDVKSESIGPTGLTHSNIYQRPPLPTT